MTSTFTLDALFRFTAAHFGSNKALIIDGRIFSYVDLERLVEEACRILHPHVRPGDRAGLWLPNTLGFVLGFLALSRLGAIVVPINTRLTAREAQFIVEDAGMRLLVTTKSYRGRHYLEEAESIARAHSFTLVAASDHEEPSAWRSILAGNAEARPLEEIPADILSIQYTSGTTSTPKGVMLTHASYLSTARYIARCQMLTPSSRFVSAAPFFHCGGSVHAITVCLMAGCSLYGFVSWDPEYFLDVIAEHGCDVCHAAFYRDIFDLDPAMVRRKLSTLQSMATIGSRADLMHLHDAFDIPGVSNLYGMTETSGNFAMWFPNDPLEKRVTRNGRPQLGNAFRIVDPGSGRVCAPGAEGEIQMKGPTVTPGYFRRPDATASALTPDGWFRSGDLGSLSAEGELHYIGRLKDIIRVGGENLSPLEVEEELNKFPGILRSCVVGVPDARLDEVPVAAVVVESAVDWTMVERALRASIAGFKVPRQFYVVEALPMTATQKVRRVEIRELILSDALQGKL